MCARALCQNKSEVVLKTPVVTPWNAIIRVRKKTGIPRRLESNISETDISLWFIDLPILVLDGEISHPSNQRPLSIVRPSGIVWTVLFSILCTTTTTSKRIRLSNMISASFPTI
ncbi:hypothetical protein NPIL_310061 [Nephila pilipes]|uniref:Uncharacterized protein n=1 Tax=Nephila pilipes TaxID=299642 RepID=A0A8X6U231_NEPPI|nr:hypothetical protein NPIL_310061 [Nephila pilipes]